MIIKRSLLLKSLDSLVSRLRILLNYKRLNPSFLIIGAQKSGTSSLYKYLTVHPRIKTAYKKEIHYFDLNFNKQFSWYISHFPIKRSNNDITGEATPYYIFHPHALKRIKSKFPKIKLIILLRNPLERTISNYKHEVKLGREKLSFEEAIKKEESLKMRKEENKMLNNELYNSKYYQNSSYLKRSIYYPQVKTVIELFDHKNVLILQSEKLFENPKGTYEKVLNFLELPTFQLSDFPVYNKSKIHESIKKDTYDYLEQYFKPHNEKLFDLIGERYDW